MRALVLAVLLAPPAAAFQSNTGGNAAEFLKVGAGARPLGMGEAFAAVADGPEAVYWNPAGLALLKTTELSYTRSEFNDFFHHDFLAVGQPVGWLGGAVGLAYSRLSQESLPLVTNGNVRAGSFSPQSHALSVAVAHRFDDTDPEVKDREYFREAWNVPGVYRPLRGRGEIWSGQVMVGGAVKMVYETLATRRATALAFDAGALFRPAGLPQLTLSFAVRHAGTREKFIAESESLPAELGFGAAWDRRTWKSRWVPAVEIVVPYYGMPRGAVGVEYSKPLPDHGAEVAVRAGYKSQTALDVSPVTGVTFGLGARWKKLTADFGFQPMAALGQTYRFTLGAKW